MLPVSGKDAILHSICLLQQFSDWLLTDTVFLFLVRHRRVCRAHNASRRLVGIPPMSKAKPKLTWNYHYRCNDRILVRSEVRRDFCCPWCSMYTGDLSGLIYHLTCSHSLFQFACGGTIEVCDVDALAPCRPHPRCITFF